VLLCSLAFSSSVSAQPLEPALAAAARVKAGLLRLAVASGGSYGDEGEQIASSIEMVAQALADINWAVRQVEARAETLDCASQLDLARALHAVGRADDALARLEIASRDHTCIDALMLQGHLHQRSGRREQALEAFLAAWRRDRTDPLAAYWFIHNEPAVTDTDEGRRAMDVLRETYRAARAGSQTRALRRFVTLGGSAASESGPVVLPAAYMRGYSLLLAGARDAALNELRKAAAADPLVVDAARSMPDVIAGIAALRGGHVSLARDRFAHAVTLAAGSSEAHRLLATAHWLERDLEGAATALQQALRLRPDDERSRLMLARVLDARGAYEDAAAVLRETLERRADSPLAQLWLAVVSQKLNREGDMAQLYVAIAEGWPIEGASRLLATAGYLYQNAVQPDAALDAFRRGVHADPNARDLHIALGRVHAEYERRDAAFAEYVAALMLAPDDPNAYLGIAQLHMIDGRYDEAVPALERVVAQYPDYAEARHVLGNALMRLGRTQEATRELREFQRLQVAATERRRRSMAVGILREEAILRASHGAVERAVSLWQQVIALEPSVASHHAELGGVLLDAGQPLTALPHLERAAALGGIPDVYRRLAAAYMQLGRRDDATAARAKYESALMEPAPPGSDR
jgi:tetratricopeptide (TPR) repeat protein